MITNQNSVKNSKALKISATQYSLQYFRILQYYIQYLNIFAILFAILSYFLILFAILVALLWHFSIPKYCNTLQYYCNAILLEPPWWHNITRITKPCWINWISRYHIFHRSAFGLIRIRWINRSNIEQALWQNTHKSNIKSNNK